ncbi:MAG: YIP1 family protein [Dysgonamonadaceae bacterium]|jgi:hypothetical protein|nr:YIP1 family protein [Dysgonamonadaceae bacterium]
MLKQLFILLFALITDPNKAWNRLAEKQEDRRNEDFYKSYLYPVVGLIALLSFTGTLFALGKFDVQIALKIVIKQIAVYFGGFYLASIVFSEWLFPRFKEGKDIHLCERFIGYSSALIYAVAMLKSLLDWPFLPLIVFYSIYMIWEGVVNYLKVEEENLVKCTLLSGIIVLFFPVALEFLIERLLPNMKI